jgi:hypothetical protein
MHDHDDHSHHDHSHHDHSHDPITSESEDSPFEAREVAIRSLLIEKGIFSADELRHRVEMMMMMLNIRRGCWPMRKRRFKNWV